MENYHKEHTKAKYNQIKHTHSNKNTTKYNNTQSILP